MKPAPPAGQLASFTVPSVPGNERLVRDRVASSVAGLLSPERADRLKTAVAEAAMNAIEHGHGNRPDLPVEVGVSRTGDEVVVTITDRGPAVRGENGDRPGAERGPAYHAEVPDLDRKLAGQQGPGGWGLFLMRHMVDAMDEVTRDGRHMVRLVMGGDHMDEPDVSMGLRWVGEDAAVIDISGDVTAAAEPALKSAYENAATAGARHLVLNFGGLEYMNSGGIGMLVTLLVHASRNRQKLAAFGLSRHYREIFELTRLDEAITICDSEQAAVAAAAAG